MSEFEYKHVSRKSQRALNQQRLPFQAGRSTVKDVTPREFIDATHGEYASLAYLATVHRDSTGASVGWFGYRADNELSRLDPNAEAYYARGIVQDVPNPDRQDHQWLASSMLVIDDVDDAGKGVNGSNSGVRVRAILGPPSFVVRTSSGGSSQWGYIFSEPVTDAAWMDALTQAVNEKFFGGADPGHRQRLQYMRLPLGKNLKPQRIAQNGGRPFDVHLTEWAPERKHSPTDMQTALFDVWGIASAKAKGISDAAATGPKTEAEAREYLKANATFRGLDTLGRVEWGRIRGNGMIGIHCPWRDEHTGGEDTAAYNPETKGFKCHHGHCTDRTGRDVEAYVAGELGEEAWSDLRRDCLPFPALVPGVDTDIDDADNDNEPGTFALTPLGRNASTAPLPERPRINPLLTRGEVTGLAAQGGGGKGALMLALALSIAAGKPGLFGDNKPFKYAGDILIVSNEDAADDLLKRRAGWLRHHGIAPETLMHEPYVVGMPNFKAVEAEGRGVRLTESMDRLAATIKAQRKTGRDVCAVVLDTLNTVLSGIEENDNGMLGSAAALLTTWAKQNNVAVLVLHHMPKAAGQTGGAGDAGALRGASALKDGLRNVVTLTKVDDKLNARLPPPDRGRVFQLDGAKNNHGNPDWSRFYHRQIVEIEVVDAEGHEGREEVPVMVPYTLSVGWASDSHNARIAVLSRLIEAEDAGEPMRVRPYGDTKGAADRIASEEEGADGRGIERTLALLEAGGLAAHGSVTTAQRKRAKAWLPTTQGREWLAAQSSGPGGFAPVESEPT